MPGIACPFCNAPVEEGAPMCLECGYKFGPAPPPSALHEMTDAQIAAYNFFDQPARRGWAPSAKQVRTVLAIIAFLLTPLVYRLIAPGGPGQDPLSTDSLRHMLQPQKSEADKAMDSFGEKGRNVDKSGN